jgi:hypothetical protein
MDKFGRLSRRDRQRVHHYNKIIVLIPLTAIIFFLFLFFFKAVIWDVTIPAIKDKLTGKSQYTLADSLINFAIRKFSISEFPQKDSIAYFDSRGRQKFQNITSQAWPRDLDFLFFNKLLSEISVENGMSCECVESKDGKGLKCGIISNGQTISAVVLTKKEKAKLILFRAAIIFDNLGVFSVQTITSLLNSGTMFSYFADPSTVPSREIKSKMSHAGISTILVLPSKNDDWARLAIDYATNPAPHGKVDRNLVDAFLLSDVFRSHPNVIAFSFNSDTVDPLIAAETMKYAKDNGIAYYYENKIPSSVDSLAYSQNLRIVRLDQNKYQGGSASSLKNHILAVLFRDGDTKESAIRIDARSIDQDELLRIQSQMDDIGVKLISCNGLLVTIDSF